VHCITVTTHQLSNAAATKDSESGRLAGEGYEGLGKLYLRMGETDNALNCYKHALEFAEKYSGPMDSHVPILMQDISKVYQSLGSFDEELHYLEQCDVFAQQLNLHIPMGVSERLKILNRRGEQYESSDSGNIEEARQVYTEVKEACIARGDQETLVKANRRLAGLEQGEGCAEQDVVEVEVKGLNLQSYRLNPRPQNVPEEKFEDVSQFEESVAQLDLSEPVVEQPIEVVSEG